MATFTVPTAAEFFNRSVEAVRVWCIEFEGYLSPTANPGEGKTRLLTDEDMTVLALVHERKTSGVHNEEIHAELRQGARGAPPAMTPSELAAISTNSEVQRLTLEKEALNGQIATLQALVTSLQASRDETIRLQTQLDSERARADKAEQTLEALKAEKDAIAAQLAALQRELGRAEGRLEEKDKPRRWRF